MEITIEREENTKGRKQQAYSVSIGNKSIISITTWAQSDLELKEWIREVQRVYGKNNRQNIVVGLCADRSLNYAKPTPNFTKGSRKDDPYELLQLCVGCHCLLCMIEPGWGPKVLKDFLYDRHTTVVGVGIEQVAKKLKKENDFMIPRLVELRELAKTEKGLQGKDLSKCSLEKLAKEVLGGEVDFVRPKTIKWWEVLWERLSDDMVKYATVEAFLAYEMGSKLLKICH